MKKRSVVAAMFVVSSCLLTVPTSVSAFCGTYVSSGGSDLYNNATQVVMLRDGNTTVMSMQNNYQGPPEDFAMVVPVPMVLQKTNVKTLKPELFDKVDRVTAPRLVEYYEVDPCQKSRYGGADAAFGFSDAAAPPPDDEVTVEEQFQVGEYNIKILSSSDSTALESWLTDRGYALPSGADTYLEPYIQQGSKFFVAKVDSTKVEFEDGQAVLSPLRFHYQSSEFKLPVRLGMLNSNGEQDLIVNILGKDQRYKAANYPNTFIPTNLRVRERVKGEFGKFYRTLFDSVMKEHPGAMVTEYAWNAGSCDPCPTEALRGAHVAALGGEVVTDGSVQSYNWVITRMHTQYSKGEIGKDIVFEPAEAIMGGRENRDEDGNLIKEPQSSSRNNFQGRYIIRHEWDGNVDCEDPRYGRWAGAPSGDPGSSPTTSSARGPTNGGATGTSGDSGPSLEDYVENSGSDDSSNSEDSTDGGDASRNATSGNDGDANETACSVSGTGTPLAAPWAMILLLGLVRISFRLRRC